MADVNVLDLSEVTPGSGDSLILFDRATGVATSTRFETLKGAVTGDVDTIVAQHTSDIQTLANKDTAIESEISDVVNALGSKNLLPNNATTQVKNGVTFTVNNDGSITANGTVTGTSDINLVISTRVIGPGDYILSGCPQGGGDSKFKLSALVDGSWNTAIEYGEGKTFHVGTSITQVNIQIRSGQTVNNIVFRPMIRHASIKDSTYVPYAMTNRELTEETVKYYSSSKYIADANFTDNATYTILEDGFYILQVQNNAQTSTADIRILIGNITTASITARNAYDRLIFNAPLKKGTVVKFQCTNTALSCNYRVTKMS